MNESNHDLVLIDFHAHLHDDVSLEDFLDSAVGNFQQPRMFHSAGSPVRGILCLADFPGAYGFSRLCDALLTPVHGWTEKKMCGSDCIQFISDQGDVLWVIAGHQVVTAEGLEIMALGSSVSPESGQALAATLQDILSLGACPVLPWGVGKWWGSRGTRVRQLLLSSQNRFFLGDNGGRPWFWSPRLFRLAQKKQRPILPGSDPLPIERDRRRNGSHGLALPLPRSLDRPSAWVKQMDGDLLLQGQPFGGHPGIVFFIGCQLSLRVRPSVN